MNAYDVQIIYLRRCFCSAKSTMKDEYFITVMCIVSTKFLGQRPDRTVSPKPTKASPTVALRTGLCVF